LLALHAAGYREVASRLGEGVVLDAGCGLGFESAGLAGPGRLVVGVDRDPGAAGDAEASFSSVGLRASCTDAARMGLRTGSFDYACSSHLVEHFDTPGRHVAEMARVLKVTGTAFFLTPNAPWDYENPFHLVLFRPRELASLLSAHFSEVWVGALDATARVKDDFATRRAKAAKVLGYADPLDLRHKVPRSWWVAVYSRALPLSYRILAKADSGGGTGITAADYFVTDEAGDDTPVLFAVASGPRRQADQRPNSTAAQPRPRAAQHPDSTAAQRPEPTANQRPEPTADQHPDSTADQHPDSTADQRPEPTASQ
jgi:SAM-dependent methyltransferase